MKKIYLLLMAFILFQLTSCETTEPQPPKEEKPPGYQEDIPWPSLADSPWPMNHHDPQSTGRSNFSGPITGSVEWQYEAINMEAGSVMDADSLVFIIPLAPQPYLKVLDLNKKQKWQYKIDGISSTTPIIGKDAIYLASNYADNNLGRVYALNLTGSLVWSILLESTVNNSSLTIGKNGDLFICDDSNNIYCISPQGEINWKINNSEFNTAITGITISPSGNTLYIPGRSVSVLAFDIINLNVKWTYGDIKMFNAPIVDNKGNIYVLPQYEEKNDSAKLFSLLPSGKLRWSYYYHHNNEIYWGNVPTIDKFGNIYFAEDTLYSLDYNGNLKWKKSLYGKADCPLICDKESNIYVSLQNIKDMPGIIEILKFNNKGESIFQITLNEFHIGASPNLGKNNDLFVSSWHSTNFYRIK